MKEVITETLIDSLKLLPFLFITFLIIELFEHRLSKKSKKAIIKSGKFGPIIGSFLGIIPQCGFSVAATNLYVTRIISLGTLVAVYLSTSDEMIPILIAEQAPLNLFIKIILLKFIIGLIFGYIIDLILRKKQIKEEIKEEIKKNSKGKKQEDKKDITSEEAKKVKDEKVNSILKKAKEKGKITYEDLAKELDDVEPDQIDQVFDAFEEIGVDLLRDDDFEEEEDI